MTGPLLAVAGALLALWLLMSVLYVALDVLLARLGWSR